MIGTVHCRREKLIQSHVVRENSTTDPAMTMWYTSMSTKRYKRQAPGRRILNEVLYREAPPQGPTPYPSYIAFLAEKVPLSYTFYRANDAPFTYHTK